MAIANLGDVPKPGPKQVLLRIHAFSLNYRDILVVDHSPNYPLQAKPDLIPGSDGAGIVEESGTESRWKKGDHVVIHPNTWLSGTDGRDWKFEETLGAGHLDGTFRRWMLVDDEHLTPAPKGISLEEACTLYTAGVTAYRALYHGGVDVKPGTTLLTQGTGGVSCYAIMVILSFVFSLVLKFCSCHLDCCRGWRYSNSHIVFGREARNRSKARRHTPCQLPKASGLVLQGTRGHQRQGCGFGRRRDRGGIHRADCQMHGICWKNQHHRRAIPRSPRTRRHNDGHFVRCKDL